MLPKEVLESITAEESTLAKVIDSLKAQRSQAIGRLQVESSRARELTSRLVAARRDEDKAMLASDEAVSHGLMDQKRDELASLDNLLKKPYFARIILEEEDEKGSLKTIEYKLGFAANPDCRIIDWRKAPISKLYYEYKEGDEYSEEILGRDRVGTVTLRNQVEISNEKLVGLTSREGNFIWSAESGQWIQVKGGRRRKDADGKLPEILSLITKEQFKAITEDATSTILIQGIAGSGKTTVGLHRMSWLLHEDNRGVDPTDCAVLVISPALRAYIESSLESVGISGVKVRTFHDWAVRTLKWSKHDPNFYYGRPVTHSNHAVERVKRSLAILKAIEGFIGRQEDKSFRTTFEDLQNDLLTVLGHPQWIIEADETRLLDRAVISESLERTRLNFRESVFDWDDDALLLRIYQLKVGAVLTERESLGKYSHIMADEVQDFSPVELATIIASVHNTSELTLVGDTSQNLDRTQSFPGWEKLRRFWNLSDEMSKFVSLEVSHRSTAQIMRLADFIQNGKKTPNGRAGRTPIWFKCTSESQGIEAAIKWLKKAQVLYPNMLTAVIASNPKEAKFAYTMLSPTFGPVLRLGDQNTFSFEEGILVTDVKQVKGLEFHSVLIWDASSINYPSSELGRNLLYVAMTRAEENLCFVTWHRPSDLLPRFGAKTDLVRFVELEEEQDIRANYS